MDYCANLMELGVDQVSEMPRATEHIPAIMVGEKAADLIRLASRAAQHNEDQASDEPAS